MRTFSVIEADLVNKINNITLQAIIHGADRGGPYEQNHERLREALEDAIETFNLNEGKTEDNPYFWRVESAIIKANDEYWPCIQIVSDQYKGNRSGLFLR